MDNEIVAQLGVASRACCTTTEREGAGERLHFLSYTKL